VVEESRQVRLVVAVRVRALRWADAQVPAGRRADGSERRTSRTIRHVQGRQRTVPRRAVGHESLWQLHRLARRVVEARRSGTLGRGLVWWEGVLLRLRGRKCVTLRGRTMSVV
jgi:hypothetical protein